MTKKVYPTVNRSRKNKWLDFIASKVYSNNGTFEQDMFCNPIAKQFPLASVINALRANSSEVITYQFPFGANTRHVLVGKLRYGGRDYSWQYNYIFNKNTIVYCMLSIREV